MLIYTRKLMESELRGSYDRTSQFWGVWTHGSMVMVVECIYVLPKYRQCDIFFCFQS